MSGMRDVSRKTKTLRTATALAVLRLGEEGRKALSSGTAPKGDPFPVARVAGIQAAKNTARLIPYCHPVPLDHVRLDFALEGQRVEIIAAVKAIWRTGVEMEALTAASIAALTVYDMLKAVDPELFIESVRLVEKKGGASDFTEKYQKQRRAAVVVCSDSISAGKKSDRSGRMIVERLEGLGVEVSDYKIIPDDSVLLAELLERYAQEEKLDLVVTTGGTGLGPRDVTPAAMKNVVDREAPGIAEAVRAYGLERTPYAMLSQGRAGVKGRTLIVNLPGSSRGVEESLDALFPWIFHAFGMIEGKGHGGTGYAGAHGESSPKDDSV